MSKRFRRLQAARAGEYEYQPPVRTHTLTRYTPGELGGPEVRLLWGKDQPAEAVRQALSFGGKPGTCWVLREYVTGEVLGVHERVTCYWQEVTEVLALRELLDKLPPWQGPGGGYQLSRPEQQAEPQQGAQP